MCPNLPDVRFYPILPYALLNIGLLDKVLKTGQSNCLFHVIGFVKKDARSATHLCAGISFMDVAICGHLLALNKADCFPVP